MDPDQERLLQKVSEVRESYRGKGYDWSKLRGDIFARLVCDYLARGLRPGLSLAANGYVEDSGIEFDLMVVDEGSKPQPFTNVYPKRNVRVLIEVKGSGYFFKKVETEEMLKMQRERVRSETGKPILYLLLRESENNSQSVFRGLRRENAFILRIGKREIPGEWDRFLERVNTLCAAT